MNKKISILDKKKLLREQDHVTRAPRFEGGVRNTKVGPVRKYHEEKKA
jgi:hypothetical protein